MQANDETLQQFSFSINQIYRILFYFVACPELLSEGLYFKNMKLSQKQITVGNILGQKMQIFLDMSVRRITIWYSLNMRTGKDI